MELKIVLLSPAKSSKQNHSFGIQINFFQKPELNFCVKVGLIVQLRWGIFKFFQFLKAKVLEQKKALSTYHFQTFTDFTQKGTFCFIFTHFTWRNFKLLAFWQAQIDSKATWRDTPDESLQTTFFALNFGFILTGRRCRIQNLHRKNVRKLHKSLLYFLVNPRKKSIQKRSFHTQNP